MSDSDKHPLEAPHEEQEEDNDEHSYFMRQALKVAKAALDIGEVPVGCVIVFPTPRGSTIVSHGANQVNATRDATRHAELVAMDRMLTGGIASDQLRLPPEVVFESAHGSIPEDSPLSTKEGRLKIIQDKWINEPDHPDHWKNEYGWGSGKLFTVEDLKHCDLYVTCEPCIMVRASFCDYPNASTIQIRYIY